MFSDVWVFSHSETPKLSLPLTLLVIESITQDGFDRCNYIFLWWLCMACHRDQQACNVCTHFSSHYSSKVFGVGYPLWREGYLKWSKSHDMLQLKALVLGTLSFVIGLMYSCKLIIASYSIIICSHVRLQWRQLMVKISNVWNQIHIGNLLKNKGRC